MPLRDSDESLLGAAREADPHGHDTPELEAIARLGDVARTITADDLELHEPPPGVWAGIVIRTQVEHLDADKAGGGRAGMPAPQAAGPESVPQPHPEPGETRHRSATVSPLVRRTWGVAAAAVAAVVVLVVGFVVVGGDGAGTEVVATARLEPLGEAAAVTADLVEADDRLELDIPLADGDLPPQDGFYEVWLIDDEIAGMVSLGPVRPDGTYAVPPEVDVERYPIVDVSIEPPDGNPTHSGSSILRGTLS